MKINKVLSLVTLSGLIMGQQAHANPGAVAAGVTVAAVAGTVLGIGIARHHDCCCEQQEKHDKHHKHHNHKQVMEEDNEEMTNDYK